LISRSQFYKLQAFSQAELLQDHQGIRIYVDMSAARKVVSRKYFYPEVTSEADDASIRDPTFEFIMKKTFLLRVYQNRVKLPVLLLT
jgi:hypothetical protein